MMLESGECWLKCNTSFVFPMTMPVPHSCECNVSICGQSLLTYHFCSDEVTILLLYQKKWVIPSTLLISWSIVPFVTTALGQCLNSISPDKWSCHVRPLLSHSLGIFISSPTSHSFGGVLSNAQLNFTVNVIHRQICCVLVQERMGVAVI